MIPHLSRSHSQSEKLEINKTVIIMVNIIRKIKLKKIYIPEHQVPR
jgi:hypothetical protein